MNPAESVTVSRFELSADLELTEIDIDSYEPHVAETPIDVLQRPTEATAHVQHALPVVRIGHVNQHSGKPLDGGLDVIRAQRLGAIARRGLIPVPHMDKAADHALMESFDKNIEVRWYSGRHVLPQHDVTSVS